MYSLLFLFISIPLIFSHFFARFGADFIIQNGIGHFESVKIHLFLILLLVATFESIWTRWDRWKTQFSKKGVFVLIGISSLLASGISLSQADTLRDLFLGIGEKQHGLLFPIGLIWLWYLLGFLSESEKRKLSYTVIASGLCIAFIAIIESFWRTNIFTGASYMITGSWGDIRSTSTLGNPNYVAGYLLAIVPLILSLKPVWKYGLLFLVIIGVIATKSVIGLSLLGVYLGYLLAKKYIGKYALPSMISVSLGILIGTYFLSPISDKWLSLESRFVLMKHTMLGSIDSFSGVVIGHGPDSIMRLFSGIRPDEISAYFPEDMIIDSSHDIFLDIFVAYGLIGLVFFAIALIFSWKYLRNEAKYGLLLLLGFLSLNVLVVSHMILLVLFLCLTHKPEKTT